MNTRAEFSNCRLQTRMGEAYLKDIEKEINDEKNMEEFANFFFFFFLKHKNTN